MLTLARCILLKLPPELAHNVAIFFLRILQWWKFSVLGVKKSDVPSIIIRQFPDLCFPTRVGLAAGFDKNAEVFGALSQFGFGFIEIGTVTPAPQKGNEKPRIWRIPNQGLVNHLGFNNVGLNRFYENILKVRKKVSIPLFANIGKGKATKNPDAVHDYVVGASLLKDCVEGLIINISSPNTPELRSLQSSDFLEQLASSLPEGIPILIKLAPDLSNTGLVTLVEQINENHRFSGVVLTNTSRQLAQERAGYSTGGLSGRPLFDRALECVTLAKNVLKPPKIIIGVGGIATKEDAKQMHEAGADLIEIYTSFIYQGPKVISELNQAFEI